MRNDLLTQFLSTITVAFVFVSASLVSAADDTVPEEQEQAPSSDEGPVLTEQQQQAYPTLEEIVVVGEKSATALRYEIRRMEVQIYDMLNDLTEEDEFKMRCGYRRRTKSYIRHYVCEPQYLVTARSRAYQEARGQIEFLGILPDETEIRMQVADKTQQHKDLIDRLARENPDLMGYIFDLQILVEEQRRRKENWWRDLFRRD